MYVGDNTDHLIAMAPPSGQVDCGGYWYMDGPGGWGGNAATALADVEAHLNSNSNLLHAYAPAAGVNHCPGDVRISNPVGSGSAVDWAYDSYAETMNISGTAANGYSTDIYSKLSDIRRPSDCMCWVEQADSRGFNDGTFEMMINKGSTLAATTITFVDLFAVYHGNVNTFAMADGHAEPHTWVDGTIVNAGLTANKANTVAYSYGQLGVSPNQNDVDATYIKTHWLSPGNP
jgi:prepilin-type processing-associated H-X9-DG protein